MHEFEKRNVIIRTKPRKSVNDMTKKSRLKRGLIGFFLSQVSWIRKQDYHLLTVGPTTYNTDDRFLVEHVRHLQNWGLLIKHVQLSDAGLYECQMSTHPPTSILIELKVTGE